MKIIIDLLYTISERHHAQTIVRRYSKTTPIIIRAAPRTDSAIVLLVRIGESYDYGCSLTFIVCHHDFMLLTWPANTTKPSGFTRDQVTHYLKANPTHAVALRRALTRFLEST